MRSLYRSVPPLEPSDPVEPEPTVEPAHEIPPIDLAAITVVEPVTEPEPITASEVVEHPAPTIVEAAVMESIPETVTTADLLGESVEAPRPLPKLDIISLERIDRSKLPARSSRSWRYSISRWAYRWWLWTREAFRHCFPMSRQPSATRGEVRNAE